MLCGVSVVFNSLGDVLGLMFCKCNSEKGQVLIGFQSEAADFEVPSPAMTGRSPSGSRTDRLGLGVDTLISIRLMAQRPSQSSACAALQVGSATSWPRSRPAMRWLRSRSN